jgi:uncharacterized protein (DUF433 family)
LAQTRRHAKQDEERLLEQYVEQNVDAYPGGQADARLRTSGVSIWAIVAFLPIYSGDPDKVADHFGIARVAVEAALAYYRRHKPYVDARIALNQA